MVSDFWKKQYMIDVGLDVRMLHNSGIGTYLRGLLAGFRTLGLENELKLFGLHEGGQAPFSFTAPIYSIQEQLQYTSLVRQCRLWHSPHYNVPLWKGKTKLVVTIHDVIHWVFRKQLLSPAQTAYAGFMLKRAVTSADHIIAVSQHTKNDLVTHFGANPEKITPIYLGVTAGFNELPKEALAVAFQKLRDKYQIPQRFFLYVGLLKTHKNISRLIRVFRQLKSDNRVSAALVLVGRKDKRYPKGEEEIANLSSAQDVVHLPSVDGDELRVLYNQALALVHPSLYEGFGLTPLEAMACGTPVLTTNSASIPEVVGDAALRVDAIDEATMADAIIRLEQNAGLRESLRQKGLERVKIFSWAETARRTAGVYKRVLNA